MRIAIEKGFKFNGKENGVWLKRFSSTTRNNKLGKLIADKTGTHASHPQYSKFLEERLSLIDVTQPASVVNQQVADLVSLVKKRVSDNPTTNINDLFK